jgi:hypothetical protein
MSAWLTGWLECLDISKLDLRLLPRDFHPGLHVDLNLTLPGAVARADLIVVATVTGFSATPATGAAVQATLAVEQTLKGLPVSIVAVTQGSIAPTQDWAGAILVADMFAEMLFPGDRAVLLLEKFGDQYWVMGESGWFRVVDDRMTPNPFNDWGASVDGMPEAQFIELLTAAAKIGPTTP